MTTEKTKSKEDLQHAYLQLQMLEGQLKEVQDQIVDIENKKQELLVMAEGLSEFKKSKKSTNSFSPMGLGIYAKSKILDNKDLLVNVGSNIFVEKPVDEIVKNLKTQLTKFESLSKTLTQNYQILSIQSQALQSQVQESMER